MLPLVILTAAAVVFRIAVGTSDAATLRALANFSPMAAVALCAGALLPRKRAVALAIGAQIAVDAGLHLLRPSEFSFFYSGLLVAAFSLVALAGGAVRRKLTLPRLLGASVCGTLLFYLFTNTGAFLYDPAYAKTSSGWIQAVTTGVPGYPPAWLFFLKSLTGDLVFTCCIALACGIGFRPVARLEPAAAVQC
jgi:hypothetical protein